MRLLFHYLVNLDCLDRVHWERTEERNRWSLNILFISLHRIQLTAKFPAELPDAQTENLNCAAIYLCTAVMDYVSVAIKVLSKSYLSVFNYLCRLMIGNVVSSLFRGNMDFDVETRRVNICIDAYTSAVVDLGSAIGIKLVSSTREIKTSVDDLSGRLETFISTFENCARIAETGCQIRSL